MLRNRSKNQGEDYKEYLYSFMEIGKPVNLDDKSLIEYFIEGIPDSRTNKSNLYQTRTMQELKEQINVYEKIPSSRPQVVNTGKTSEAKNRIGLKNITKNDLSVVFNLI